MNHLVVAWLVAGALVAETPPREVVQSAVSRVVAILGAEMPRPESERAGRRHDARRRAEIRRVALDLFDFDEVARRTLSRHWAGRSPAEQVEFVELFTDFLERSYIGKIEAYSGERIVYPGETVDGQHALVRSRIQAPKGEIALDYRLSLRDGRWRVYDVLINGISFVATYRTEFNRIIQLSSWTELIERLRKKRGEVAVVGRGDEGH